MNTAFYIFIGFMVYAALANLFVLITSIFFEPFYNKHFNNEEKWQELRDAIKNCKNADHIPQRMSWEDMMP